MPDIYPDAAAVVGDTPLVELTRLADGLPGKVLAKLEMSNPCGSVKDRLGLALIEDAEKHGRLTPGMTLVEPTGGNTGIGLAFVAAIRGYRLVLTMPATMSTERIALLRHLGTEVVLTPGILMTDAIARAREIVNETPGALMLNQFENPANATMHERTTGPEIWRDTGGTIDTFVSAVGTGGTLTGTMRFLRTKNPSTKSVAVEPAAAAVLSGREPGQHRIPGIGVGFVPEVLDRDLIDEVIAVEDTEAFEGSRRLAREEGILAGPSSGAAVCAALSVAARQESSDKAIVVLLADSAERYVTTDLMAPIGSTE